MEIDAKFEGMRETRINFETYANNYKKGLDTIYEIVNTLSSKGIWEGSDYEKYVERINEKKRELEELGEQIRMYGKFFSNSMNRIKNSQEEIRRTIG